MLVAGNHNEQRADIINAVQSYLQDTGMTIRVVISADTLPTAVRIANGAKAMCEFKPDWIVALGGGTIISAAKAMLILYEHPWMRLETLGTADSFPELRAKARFVAISTTSGTGAEATGLCVLYNVAENQSYCMISDYALTPDIAVVDPTLTGRMPLALRAYAGMDGLSHAMEALMSKRASLFTNALAKEAAKQFFACFEQSFHDDLEIKERLHSAQCISGIAFSNAGGGLVHAMSFHIEATLTDYHIPHGCINAVLLPYVVKLNVEDLNEDFKEVLELAAINTKNGFAEGLFHRIRLICNNIGIPSSLMALGVREADFMNSLDYMIHGIAADAGAAVNQREIRPDDIKKVLVDAYRGTEILQNNI